MRDEDNKYGLRITKNRGDNLIAYGDGMLLNEESESNYRIAVAAVQSSVDHVYEAFLYPEKETSSSRVTDYIPFVDPSEKNNYAMFQVKDCKLPRRADLENLGDPTTKATGLEWEQCCRSELIIHMNQPLKNMMMKSTVAVAVRACIQKFYQKIWRRK